MYRRKHVKEVGYISGLDLNGDITKLIDILSEFNEQGANEIEIRYSDIDGIELYAFKVDKDAIDFDVRMDALERKNANKILEKERNTLQDTAILITSCE